MNEYATSYTLECVLHKFIFVFTRTNFLLYNFFYSVPIAQMPVRQLSIGDLLSKFYLPAEAPPQKGVERGHLTQSKISIQNLTFRAA